MGRYSGSHRGKIDTKAPTVGRYSCSNSGQIFMLTQCEDTKAPTLGRYSGSHSGQILRLPQWEDTQAPTEGRYSDSWAEIIKLFSCSTQMSMKSKMLINIEIAKIYGIFRFYSLKPAIYPAN